MSKLTHDDLCFLAEILGHQGVTAGFCFGFSLAYAQAHLAGQQNHFLARLKLIEEYPDFKNLIIDIGKAREKVKNGLLLNDRETQLIEIPAFFDTILLYQSPEQYSDVFLSENTWTQKDFSRIYQFTNSLQLCDTTLYTPLNQIYIMDKKTLENYLEDLKKIISDNNIVLPLVLQNDRHAITFNLDTDNETHEPIWQYIDTNDFEKFPDEQNYFRSLSNNTLSHALFDSLAGGESICINSLGLMTNSDLKLEEEFKKLEVKYSEARHDVKRVNAQGIGLLHFALLKNNDELLQELLTHDPDPNKITVEGITPLLITVALNKADIFKVLLEKGGDVNLQIPELDNHTLLMSILMEPIQENPSELNKHLDIIETVLHHPDLNLQVTCTDGTVLDVLLKTDKDVYIDFIFNHLSNSSIFLPGLMSDSSWEKLIYRINKTDPAFKEYLITQTEQYLKSKGVNIEQVDGREYNAFHQILESGHLRFLQSLFLLKNKIDINHQASGLHQCTPLMMAVFSPHTKNIAPIFVDFLANGASLLIKNSHGHTALDIAIETNNFQATEVFLRHAQQQNISLTSILSQSSWEKLINCPLVVKNSSLNTFVTTHHNQNFKSRYEEISSNTPLDSESNSKFRNCL